MSRRLWFEDLLLVFQAAEEILANSRFDGLGHGTESNFADHPVLSDFFLLTSCSTEEVSCKQVLVGTRKSSYSREFSLVLSSAYARLQDSMYSVPPLSLAIEVRHHPTSIHIFECTAKCSIREIEVLPEVDRKFRETQVVVY